MKSEKYINYNECNGVQLIVIKEIFKTLTCSKWVEDSFLETYVYLFKNDILIDYKKVGEENEQK